VGPIDEGEPVQPWESNTFCMKTYSGEISESGSSWGRKAS
jgi:hypothetical protein